MSYSLNEMEATTKRATRGAGYPWGLAEDAAKAARWLCAQGLDGSAEMAQVLERRFAEHPAKHRPQSHEGVWRAEGDLCPISAGALLSDCAELESCTDRDAARGGPIGSAALCGQRGKTSGWLCPCHL